MIFWLDLCNSKSGFIKLEFLPLLSLLVLVVFLRGKTSIFSYRFIDFTEVFKQSTLIPLFFYIAYPLYNSLILAFTLIMQS